MTSKGKENGHPAHGSDGGGSTAGSKRPQEAVPRWRRVWPPPLWLLFMVILAVNYTVSRVFFPEPTAITVSYTFFKQQVGAGNVAHVASAGDSISGSFKTEVTYPPPQALVDDAAAAPAPDPRKSRTSMQFKTQRPVFADPGLERLLEEKGVVIEATQEGRSSWFTLLVGFGPTLLLIAAFVWISRRREESP